MKNLFTLLLLISISFTCFAQNRAITAQSQRDIAVKTRMPAIESAQVVGSGAPMAKSVDLDPVEENIGMTRYDDQSNASMQNRLYLFDDGTMGATWIFGTDDPNSFPDRGSGYNYFDGSSWGAIPTARIEDEKTGWPSYAPWGENGEIIVAHSSGAGLKISTRPEKGTGDWTFSTHDGPPDHEYLIWNRSVTSGIDHNRIHVLGLTASTAYSGTIYEGLDGALVYSRSLDGGATWDINNAILDGMTSDDYFGFTSDNYAWAEPKGDIVAFVCGESWYDLFLMKSTDGGQTFTKTVIWEHPYPLYDFTYATDTFYCVDGAISCAIDNSGKVHVVFGIDRAYGDGTSTYWFPFVDGVGYWNEDMPTFSNDLNALSPYGDPGSEMVEDVNLIGWAQDVDNDGVITWLTDYAPYYLGASSMPQIVIGQNGALYLVFSSITETFSNGIMNYRHLWARVSPDGGNTWGDFHDLTSAIAHIFDECVYPSCAANSDDYLYLTYQRDNEPGNAAWAGTHGYVDNDIVLMKVDKTEITGIHENDNYITSYDVGQNQPNPFTGSSVVEVNLHKATTLQLEVTNLIGQLVYSASKEALPGGNRLTIHAEGLSSGVYFYTVKAGNNSVTKKMIVE